LSFPSGGASVRDPMDVHEASRGPRFTPRPATPGGVTPGSMPIKNSVTASQARAARRREARRDEQAVAAWLRELAARNR
jgi:hypothetical protein